MYIFKKGFNLIMRYEYMHNLRGFAILLVIYGHAVAALNSIDGIYLIRDLLVNGTVLFVVIAGYFFSVVETRYTYKKYLFSKLKNVVFPYIFLSIPAILIYILGYKSHHTWVDIDVLRQSSLIEQIIFYLTTGSHLGPLWFIPMIIVFYILFPFFKLIKYNPLFNFFIIISVVVSVFVGRPENNDNALQSFIYFIPAYLIGIYIHANKGFISSVSARSDIYLAACIIASLFLYSFFGYNSSIDMCIKLLISIFSFGLFYKYLDFKLKFFGMLASISFYLFFVHGYLTGAARILLKKTNYIDNSLLLSVAIFMLVTLFSVLSYFLLKPLFGVRKKEFLGADY